MDRKRVVVTGLGTLSPIGNTVKETWEGLLEGRSGISPITRFDTGELLTRFAGEVKGFDPVAELGHKLARRLDRVTQMALVATKQALEHAKLKITETNQERIGSVLGTGIGGISSLIDGLKKYLDSGPRWVSPFMIPMMLPDAPGGQLAISFGMRGPNYAIVTACASGTNAVGEATEIIRRGEADAMVAGGAEAPLVPLAIAGFNRMDAMSKRNDDPQRASRPFDLDRDGFVVGEGSAQLVLESFEHAVERGAPILAEVVGYGQTNDAHHVTAPAENGAGAAKCMELALENAGVELDKIDYINAHGTSTMLNDMSETAAIKTVFGEAAYDIPISSTKSMTGHLLGAAGGVEAMACVKAIEDKVMPPTINYETPDPVCDLDYVPNTKREKELGYAMSNSFGFGGHNATLIFGKVRHDQEFDEAGP